MLITPACSSAAAEVREMRKTPVNQYANTGCAELLQKELYL